MSLAGQVHEVDLVELAPFGVEEVDIVALRDHLKLGRDPAGSLHTAVAHDLIVEAFLDAGRGHDQNVGGLAAPAVYALAFLDQALHACADTGGIGSETLLDVVGAQHEDEQINDLVALEQGVAHAQGVHGLVDGVHKNGGPAGQTFFGDEVLVAQCSL